jgi:hypothetical protein
MAEAKAKRPRRWKQPKWPIYEALYRLNAAFQTIAAEIERIDDYEAIPLETLRLYRMTAEELRSAMNHHLTGILLTREEQDWHDYGKQKREIEEHLKSL